jgi:hypothetical protein
VSPSILPLLLSGLRSIYLLLLCRFAINLPFFVRFAINLPSFLSGLRSIYLLLLGLRSIYLLLCRFAINFFTSIGLGGLTEDLRTHLKAAPKPTAVVAPVIQRSSRVSAFSYFLGQEQVMQRWYPTTGRRYTLPVKGYAGCRRVIGKKGLMLSPVLLIQIRDPRCLFYPWIRNGFFPDHGSPTHFLRAY